MSANSNKLAGKVAVVTGASKGIGAAIAKALAAERPCLKGIVTQTTWYWAQ